MWFGKSRGNKSPGIPRRGVKIILGQEYEIWNEMGGACGAYGVGKRCAQGSSGETWGKEIIGETQT